MIHIPKGDYELTFDDGDKRTSFLNSNEARTITNNMGLLRVKEIRLKEVSF